MRNIHRRLKELSKAFPPLKDTGPELLRGAALARLSEEELLLLLEINAKQERSPVQPLSEPELRALEAYDSALKLASRQARLPYRLTRTSRDA